jgi:hypothetical protein
MLETCIDRQPSGLSDLCHYVIVRADLPHGSQVAQAVHAAGETTPARLPSGTIAVALAARDQAHLLEVAAALARAGITHKVIVESDGQAMALGIEPTRDRARVRKEVSNLPLVR